MRTVLSWIAFTGIAAGLLQAHERMWTFTYDTDPVPRGLVEVEPWVTYETGRTPGDYFAWKTRLEVEYAPTPLLTVAFYLNTSRTFWATDQQVVQQGGFDGISLAFFQRITHPRENWVGTGVYGEITFEGNKTALEEKLIFSRWITDRINAALNLILEQEWEREWEMTPSGTLEQRVEREAVMQLTGGITYTQRTWGAGLEWRVHHEWPDRLFPGPDPEHVAVFVGPALHYSASGIWVTLSVLPQVTSVLDKHGRIVVRTILGVVF